MHLDVADFSVSSADVAAGGMSALLGGLTVSLWGESAKEVGRLLCVAPPRVSGRGKPNRGFKAGQQALKDFPQVYERLQRWSERVFGYQWSQAQLLQVMEEVEPMVIEALQWLHIAAVTLVGSYAHLGALLAKSVKDEEKVNALLLGLASGLDTPEARLLQTLAAGASPEDLRESFAHLPLQAEGEMAFVRVGEAPQTFLGALPLPQPSKWDLARAQRRREAAMVTAFAGAGLFVRSGLKKIIALTQAALIMHAQARDALAFVLAATRHWALAAAAEGMSDGRIQQTDEIFMLEIEEIKQMLTGEWHSREHIAPLISGRRSAYHQEAIQQQTVAGPLGVAGEGKQGVLLPLQTPNVTAAPPGYIALARNWTPAWWRVILGAEGLIALDGDLLSWIAAMARAGDLPALVGGSAYDDWASGAVIRLEPDKNRAEKLI